MPIIEWILLAHLVGVALEEQSEFQIGCFPWVTFEMNLTKLNDTLFAEDGFVPWPTDRLQRFNACTDPCDMWTGPCACGATHRAGV